MTEEEKLQAIARVAAKETVTEVFARLGLDVDEYKEVQQDFAHLRAWRLSMDTIKRQGFMTAAAVATAGLLALIWQSVKGNG